MMRPRLRDEGGSTLPMLLVFIVIVSMVGVATLNLQSTAFTSHTIYIDKAKNDVSYRDSLSNAVQTIRYTADAGRYGGSSGCNGQSPTQLASTADAAGAPVSVWCMPYDNQSGARPLGNADLPLATVVTLGGAAGAGNTQASTADDRIPFCDDWHARTSGVCEAGMYIGRSSATINGEGGFWIARNQPGNTDTVRSNSSIIVRNDGDAQRKLKVEGNVWARRSCTSGLVLQQWSTTTQTGVAPGCNQSSQLMTIDDCSGGRVIGKDCFPYYPRTTQLDAFRSATNEAGTFPTGFAAGVKARMTPMTVPACGNTGYVQFKPGYYKDINSLDDLMDNCGDTLFHFLPGAYYFDFDGGPTATVWTEPKGNNGLLSQIVGGTASTTWTPCPAPSFSCSGVAQPAKDMQFQISGYSNATTDHWPDPANAQYIDDGGDPGTVKANTSKGWIEYNAPQVHLPERTDTQVTDLTFNIKADAKDSSGYAPGWPKFIATLPGGAHCDWTLPTSVSTLQTYSFPVIKNGAVVASPGCTATSGWAARIAKVLETTASCTQPCGPQLVNGVTLDYEVKSTAFATTVRGEVDGVSMTVKYKGRPTPQMPDACDNQQPGVQFAFGNTSRMNFNANNAFVELCGSATDTTKTDGSQFALAIYGMPEHAADAPRRYVSSAQSLDVGNNNNLRYPLMSDPSTIAAKVGTIDGNDATGTSCTSCNTGGVLKSAVWNDNAPGRVSFYGQANDPSIPTTAPIPAGSTITGVEMRIRHAEGTPPTAPNYGSDLTDTGPVGSVKVTIAPRASGQGVGSNGETAGAYSMFVPTCQNFKMPVGDPRCDFRFGYFDKLPPSPWEDQRATSSMWTTDTNPCWGSTSVKAGTITSPASASVTRPSGQNCTWFDTTAQRSLRDAMSTPEAWNAPQITVDYGSNTGGTPKVAWLDGVEFRVYYRPPGTLRPLRGCLTTRSGVNPYASSGDQLVGTDHDWDARSGATGGPSDSSYTTGTNTDDTESCALIRMISNQTDGVKLHIQGMVYAPTAALDLSGKDNESPFVTDGLVVRHLTVWRWRTGHDIPGLGQAYGDRNPRKVWLWVKDAAGNVLAKELVTIDDNGGRTWGQAASVGQYLLAPSSGQPVFRASS